MGRQLGKMLVSAGIVTEQQLHEGLERQRIHKGKLGDNLEALGYVQDSDLVRLLRQIPPPPVRVEDTGLELSFIADLVTKHIVFMSEFTLVDVEERIKLPASIVDASVEMLRRGKIVEVLSAEGYATSTYRFRITELGRKRAQDLLDICRYVGPAPVPLDVYHTMVVTQSINGIPLDEGVLRKAYSHLVIEDNFFSRLGPAIASGKSLFMYGPSGNGKTALAENIKAMLPDTILIPYAIIVMGQIVNIFDPVTHELAETGYPPDELDQRWVVTKRPVVVVGGELTARMLDLDFNSIAKYYEAPLQMKANNGLFIIDDFGRQQIEPRAFLNRWIFPLEKRVDFINLHTGIKIQIPFDLFVIFATNLEPAELVDEAFLRRIRYKIKVDRPSTEQFEAIFRKVCDRNGIAFEPQVFERLMGHYRKSGVKLAACHPRDIVDHIIDNSRYKHRGVRMTEEAIDAAWENYFVEPGQHNA
ncbi:ATPase [Geobacter hydrogenophilus]|uniref:ATPase AAA n=1 Tax=Geobacter hydrogenophilus TaxID=40983 RepID=A0A9W6G159_9BACT|nr:ATPase [Geobacter hydrogenophilus]MBT0893225.1 ATPase [Geobacter hydrogenophilus]GLI38930.1 ATPase AAA [Geobacter hydrogenophilus]